MRTIKFRGKRLDNEEWVYGYYVCLQDTFRKPINKQERITHRIYTGYADSFASEDGYDFSEDWVDIDPETVGQFTGVFDCQGKEIYEGDIVRTRITNGRFKANPKYKNYVVHYDERNGCFATDWYIPFRSERMEVIGNIHDNPELIEGVKA